MKKLNDRDFSQIFGIAEEQLPPKCRELISASDFRYSRLNTETRDATILEMFKVLSSAMTVSGKSRLPQWEEGWSQNLSGFLSSGHDPFELNPRYLRRGAQVIRLLGDYALPKDPLFEVNFLSVLRIWVGETYFKNVDHIYEIGCGPAHNLFALAKLFPEKKYHGLDWATSSQEIIAEIVKSHGLPIDGHRFDMFSPDEDFRMEKKSVVLTIGAMEQVGKDFESFLQFLLKEGPRLCIHFEPIYETYDSAQLFEFLGASYHMKRGYLIGFLPRLQELEKERKLRILKIQKNFGSLHHDGWTNIVWQPMSTN